MRLFIIFALFALISTPFIDMSFIESAISIDLFPGALQSYKTLQF